MSHEQVRGDPLGARADFFGLGAVLCEMLSGHRARFSAGPVVETGYAVLHNEPEPLRANIPGAGHPGCAPLSREGPGTARNLALNLEFCRRPTGSTAQPSRRRRSLGDVSLRVTRLCGGPGPRQAVTGW